MINPRISKDGKEGEKARGVEEAPMTSYVHLERIFNAVADGIHVIDKDFNLLRANDTFSKLFGLDKDDIIGKKCYNLLFSSLCHTPGCPMNRFINGEERIECEVEKRRHDGTKIVCLLTATPCRRDNGELIGLVEHFKDVTERKKVEEENKKQQKLINEFSEKLSSIRRKERRIISADLHDELGSMAIGIDTALVIAESKIREKDMSAALKSIRQSRQNLKKATENLKRIAKSIRPSNLDTDDFFKGLKEYFLNILKYSDIKADFNLDLDKKRLNDNMAIALYRVTQEALNNVIKHANAKNVKIMLYSEKENLKFNISDDGKGFDSKDTFEKIETTKMGLRGIKERIESLGGRFSIESAPTNGTSISIILPNVEGEL
jgi:PAS domain S-box-containing protein